MKAQIVLAHPEKQSFNARLADITQQVPGADGWQTTLTDLYAMDFDSRGGPRHYSSRQDE